jgi:membrane-bound serine protease (ClpP class)
LTTAITVAVPFAVITILLVSLVIKARANKVVTGDSGMIDTIGVVQTPLTPEGKILVRGEYWDAVSSTPLEPGSQVRVTRVDGLTLRVEPVKEKVVG